MQKISRRRFSAGAAAAAASCGLSLEAAVKTSADGGRRPNILFLLTDDQRWDNLGCAGHAIVRTPNLDALASQGTLLANNFCTTSICCASRASILTGMYASTHGIERFDVPLSPGQFAQSYPALLRRAGYRTGFIGKWGLGGAMPENGFDVWRGFAGQGRYYHDIDGERVHLNSILRDQAVEFIEGCSREQPFCLSLSFKAPHELDGDPWPYQCETDLADLYEDAEIPLPPTSGEEHHARLPEFVRTSEGRTRWDAYFGTPEQFQKSLKDIYRLITGVDRVVGDMYRALRRRGLSDNTVVIFTSDNGAFHGEHGLAGKWLMYEESIRTPLLIYDPRLPASRRGRRIEEMSLNIDLAPTMLDLAGLPRPDGADGHSLVPLLKGHALEWRREWFYEHHYGHGGRIPVTEGVRTEEWTYTRYPETQPLYEDLFDLSADPLQVSNLARDSRHARTLDDLRARLERWREQQSRRKGLT